VIKRRSCAKYSSSSIVLQLALEPFNYFTLNVEAIYSSVMPKYLTTTECRTLDEDSNFITQ